ncbi:MAG: helix-hairpin-helix domain-containing protein [Acidobacteria bacterium]|nr:helix-hairpin-helix domain-containing protein [Acidobacteriota bacterium]
MLRYSITHLRSPLLWLIAAGCTSELAHAQASKVQMPDGPGKAVTQRICGNCHGPGIFTKRRLDREGWADIVDDMIRRGAKGEDEDFVMVMDYLVQNFSKAAAVRRVNVNSAEAAELAEVLGLAEDQAVKLVEHRRAKGNFKTIDDLKKVPGLDTQAVDARKDRIDF